jgi:hypothetical protein
MYCFEYTPPTTRNAKQSGVLSLSYTRPLFRLVHPPAGLFIFQADFLIASLLHFVPGSAVPVALSSSGICRHIA